MVFRIAAIHQRTEASCGVARTRSVSKGIARTAPNPLSFLSAGRHGGACPRLDSERISDRSVGISGSTTSLQHGAREDQHCALRAIGPRRIGSRGIHLRTTANARWPESLRIHECTHEIDRVEDDPTAALHGDGSVSARLAGRSALGRCGSRRRDPHRATERNDPRSGHRPSKPSHPLRCRLARQRLSQQRRYGCLQEHRRRRHLGRHRPDDPY